MAGSFPDEEYNQMLKYHSDYDEQNVVFYLDSPTSSSEPGKYHELRSEGTCSTDGTTDKHMMDDEHANKAMSTEGQSATGDDSSSKPDGCVLSEAQNDSVAPAVSGGDEEIRFIDEDAESQLDDDAAPATPSPSSASSASAAATGDKNPEENGKYKVKEGTSEGGEKACDSATRAQAADQPSTDEIMTRFEETEKIFREKFLSPSLMDLSMRKEAQLELTPPVSPLGDSSFVERLEQLIKVLEQLSFLRKQNEQLRKKCNFLENTRYLLQLQNDMLMARDFGRSRSRFKQNQRMMNFFDSAASKMTFDIGPTRPRQNRLPSDGGERFHDPSMPDKMAKLSRSQSDGSLDLVDMEFSIDAESTRIASTEKASSPTTREYFMSRSDLQKKSRKLQQKWERVKKVFSGKPEHAVKTDAVSAEQLVKANTKPALDKRRPPNLEDLPKPDAVLHDNPPTPNSVHSEPTDVHTSASGMDIAEEIGAAKLRRSFSADTISSNSSSINQRFTFDERSISNTSEVSLERIRYMQLGGHLERRRSSPTLSVHDGDKDYISVPEASTRMVRSSSVKLMKSSAELDVECRSGKKITSSDAAKKAKAAWVRVKDIIHTRKDSLKKNKQMAHALSDGEISPDDPCTEAKFHIGDGSELDTRQSRDRTKKQRGARTGSQSSSQQRLRHRTVVAGTLSPGLKYKRKSLAHVVLGNSPTDVASMMGITDDFNKRLHEWEEKKKKGLVKANSFSYDMESQKSFDTSTKFTEDFIKKMEEWEQMKGLSSPPKSPDREKEVAHSEQVTVHDAASKAPLQNLSESFSKTVQEWERVKERRAREGTSPGPESRGRERYIERSKSRERDRSRHKFEKEIQKIERKEWKIEREKQKLERMKMKLDMAMESSSGSEGFGEGMTYEMLKKQLQDRENRHTAQQQADDKATVSRSELLTEESIGLHSRSMSTKEFNTEGKPVNRDRVLSDSCIQPLPAQRSISYEPYPALSESTQGRTGMATLEAPPRDVRGKSSETDDSGTQQYASSEKSISTLLQQLEDKDDQIKDLQYDVQQLTERINLMDREHNQKIESYKRQLKAAHRLSHFACQTYQIDGALKEVRAQVDVLIQAQEILMKEKQALERQIQAGMEEHESVKAQCLAQLQKLQERVDQLCGSNYDQPRPTVTALCGLINQAQDQLSRLQQTLSNRTSTIHDLERHLLAQKVNNKLLEAGLQRQALEINYLQEKQRRHIMKRSKTFSGQEFCLRQEGQHATTNESKLQDEIRSHYLLSKRSASPHLATNVEATDFDLPLDWLNAIRKQLEEECKKPPEVSSKPRTTSTECQTVMTLISCPYTSLPGASGQEKSAQNTESNKQGKGGDTEMKSASTQTSHEEGQVVIKATVTNVDVPLVTATCESLSKLGILKTSMLPPSGSEVKADVRTGHRYRGALTGSPPSSTVAKCRSYQEWLDREPKPLKLDMGRAASFDVCDVGQSGKMSSQSSDEVFTSREEISCDTGPDTNSRNASTSTNASSPHLPQSPIIRSKNVRKLKNTDSRVAAITGDARTWKATPPRRFIRHRRNMVERLSMGAVLSEGDNLLDEHQTTSERQRTKSDSSELSRACQIARENSLKKNHGEASSSSERVSVAQNLLEVRSYVSRHTARSSSGVRDMINRYEEGNFHRSGVFRKSPSPSVPKVSVTATRRLKTAAELLQDSIDQKQHRSRSASTSDKPASSPPPARGSLPSTSSDKENHNNLARCQEDGQSSAASPSSASRRTAKSALQSSAQSAVAEGQAGTPELARPLKDVTNDKNDQGSAHGLPSPDQDSPNLTHPSPSLSSSEISLKSKKAAVLSYTPTSSPSKQSRTSHDPAKPSDSTLDPKTARHMSKGDSIDSQSTWSCRSSEQDDSCTDSGSPWHLAKDLTKSSPSPVTPRSEHKPRSKSKARFWSKEPRDKTPSKSRGLFDKKRTKSQSPGRAGAISQLCMQTMTLSVNDDSSDSQAAVTQATDVTGAVPELASQSPGSDTGDKRSRRQKFLDSNWFQKPKGLFRVSKC